MNASVGDTLKHRYLGFITGLRPEMFEPRRGKPDFDSSQPQTLQEPLKTFLQHCTSYLGRYSRMSTLLSPPAGPSRKEGQWTLLASIKRYRAKKNTWKHGFILSLRTKNGQVFDTLNHYPATGIGGFEIHVQPMKFLNVKSFRR